MVATCRRSRGEGPGEQVKLVSDRAAARLEAAGVTDGLSIETRKPEWLRPKVELGADVMALKKTVLDLDLVTVCEDAGCPNLSECWADGTATFMVLGERCTRACGFCLVDTNKPLAPAADEPQRVAEAIERMELDHAVLTMVARDDLADGGMAHVAACVEAIRSRRPATRIETLISDAKGDETALDLLLAVRPDVLNHNVETVARLQRAVRPSAGYARSLGVLARAKAAGLTTKTGFMVGLGETDGEIDGLLADLADLGVDIVTIGQYLRPTSHHLPIVRYAEPAEFERWKQLGESYGIGHVEASPLTRSSYHAKGAAESVAVRGAGGRRRLPPDAVTRWSPEQVEAIAPTPAALSAARPLTTVAKWGGLGADERAVWGSCRGSGAEPYDTMVDHVGVASRCTCPSRRHPCKHVLALLLLWVHGDVADTTAPSG